MKNIEDLKILQDLEIEDIVWYIYVFIAVFALISNQYERDYVITNNMKSNTAFHTINIIIFCVAFFIYLYFLYTKSENFTKKRDLNSALALIGTIFLVVAGALLLIAEVRNSNDEAIVGI